jgi:hypothetical protein
MRSPGDVRSDPKQSSRQPERAGIGKRLQHDFPPSTRASKFRRLSESR